MKKIILLLILFRILLVIAVEKEIDDILIVPRTRSRSNLPKLYTWNFKKKKYERILNKNGDITKKYNGGIFLLENDVYKPIHKAKGPTPIRKKKSTSKTTTIISKKNNKRKGVATIISCTNC
jgi:hypothetical protein